MQEEKHKFTQTVEDYPGFETPGTVEFTAHMELHAKLNGPHTVGYYWHVDGISWNKALYTQEQNDSIQKHLDVMYDEYKEEALNYYGETNY
jgi:hypothetical protein